MKFISLTKGKYAIVDDDEILDGRKYYCNTNGYATRSTSRIFGKQRQSFLHIEIYEKMIGRKLNGGEEVDHEDRNPLNCQKSNLRFATRGQNTHNIGLRSTNTSGYIGVNWNSKLGKWRVRISKDSKRICLGCYDDIQQAAKIYDEAAKIYHGDFAVLNFPESEG